MGGVNTSGLTQTANQLGSEQSSLLNYLMSTLGQMGGNASSMTSLLGPTSNIWQNLLNATGQLTPQAMQQYMTLAMSPNALAKFTGVNAPGMVQGATSYLSNPNATNLSQGMPGLQSQLTPGSSALNLYGPQAAGFYQKELTQGLNPQYVENAQNQLTQQFQQAAQTAMSNAAPGQNTGATLQGLNNQFLTSAANLGGQLAGESQQASQQGAQGLVGTGQAIDQNTLARVLQSANLSSTLDQQKFNMLVNAAQMGTGYNQGVLGNIGGAGSAGTGVLSGAGGFGMSGENILSNIAGITQGTAGMVGNEAMNYTQLATQLAASAPNIFSILAQLGGGAANAYATVNGIPGKSSSGSPGGDGGPLLGLGG